MKAVGLCARQRDERERGEGMRDRERGEKQRGG